MSNYISSLIQCSPSDLHEKGKNLNVKLIELDKMPLGKASLVISKDNSTIILVDKRLKSKDKNLLTLYHLFQLFLYKKNVVLSHEKLMVATLYYMQKNEIKISSYKDLLFNLNFSLRRLYIQVAILNILCKLTKPQTKVKL